MMGISWHADRRARCCRCGKSLGIFLLAGVLLSSAGCQPPAPPKTGKNPKVLVTTPIHDIVIDYQDFTGRLEAVKSIEIRARVSGYVMEASFKEGDFVPQDKTLFEIDPRPYQADFNQAEANLKVAAAEHNLQEKTAERARKLTQSNSISREEFETAVALLEKSAATVGAAVAAKDRAKLYLDYTKVKAPIAGRISRRFVDPGNLASADTTVLTTLVTESPMFAYFDVDERTYLDLLGHIAPGQKSWYEGLKLPVLMRLANEKEFERQGVVDFVDNRVIATTGTVRMRGVFENPQKMLKAGLFVRIRLPMGTPYQAIVIPDEAIQSDQERKYVWVVSSKNEVEYRSVKPGQALGELRVIQAPEKGKEGREGLRVDEQIIVSGMQRVRKGIQVDKEKQAPPTPPDIPLVRILNRQGKDGNASTPAGKTDADVSSKR